MDNQATKTCFKCRSVLPVDDFYKHKTMRDGRLNKCKECAKRDAIANRISHLEYYRKYDRERGSRNITSPKPNKEASRKAKNRHAFLNPLKTKARNSLSNAIRDGKIKKGPCECCGSTSNIHGHHENYRFPLIVNWLCEPCHKWWHKIRRGYKP